MLNIVSAPLGNNECSHWNVNKIGLDWRDGKIAEWIYIKGYKEIAARRKGIKTWANGNDRTDEGLNES